MNNIISVKITYVRLIWKLFTHRWIVKSKRLSLVVQSLHCPGIFGLPDLTFLFPPVTEFELQIDSNIFSWTKYKSSTMIVEEYNA